MVPVPVPDFTGGSGTGAKFSFGRVLVQSNINHATKVYL